MRTLLLSLALLLITVPGVVSAQPLTNLEGDSAFIPLTSIPGIESAGNSQNLPDFLNSLYQLAIGAAAVLAVLQIVRAGIMYMGGDSVTEKKEAKSLIMLSIGGLVLILSPVIVFSIINPDILSLKIGKLDELTNTSFDAYEPGQVIGGGGTGGECSSYTAVLAISANLSCSSQYAGDGFEKVADSCCSGLGSGKICCGSKTVKPAAAPAATTPQSCQATYSLVQASSYAPAGYEVADNACCSSVGSGQKCYGKKKATTTSPTRMWGWRYAVVNASNQHTTVQLGGFTTQKQCQDSITPYMQKNGLSIMETQKSACTCETDLSKQPGCSTI